MPPSSQAILVILEKPKTSKKIEAAGECWSTSVGWQEKGGGVHPETSGNHQLTPHQSERYTSIYLLNQYIKPSLGNLPGVLKERLGDYNSVFAYIYCQ